MYLVIFRKLPNFIFRLTPHNLQKSLKFSSWVFSFFVGVALGKSLPEFVYFAVEICHRGPLPSATPGFSFWQKLCETAKHQRRRSAWVGQADFRKVEPNNGNRRGNCQRLSALHEKHEKKKKKKKKKRYAREVQF